MWDLRSLTRDGTHTPLYWKHGILTTGPPEKSQEWVLQTLKGLSGFKSQPKSPLAEWPGASYWTWVCFGFSTCKMGVVKSWWASLVAHTVKNPSAIRKTWVWSLGWEDPLEEGMAIHASIFAWRIPMDRGTWQATVYGVAKSQTWLSAYAQIMVPFSLDCCKLTT